MRSIQDRFKFETAGIKNEEPRVVSINERPFSSGANREPLIFSAGKLHQNSGSKEI
jgi:hypothetical protein